MLRNLIIKNYALIESLDLEFGPGLTIITGETGAGKSIMLGALSLVMGGRADTKVISDGNSKSLVQALFVDVDTELKPLFEEKGIDWVVNDQNSAEISIRRELSASGRSKVFVNDCAVTLQTLSLIVPRLIDIHSQHANTKINDAAERLHIIDSMAENDEIRSRYKRVFQKYADIRRRIKTLREEMARSSQNLEFLKFQLSSLDKLNPKKGELKEIENKFEILSDADEIKERLQLLTSLIGNGDRAAQSLIAEAETVTSKINFGLFDSSIVDENHESKESSSNPLSERLKALNIELKDIASTIEDFNSKIETDPAALSKLSDRMNLYYDTMKRFGVADADQLESLHNDIKRKISQVRGEGGEISELEKDSRLIASELRSVADMLSDSRHKAAEEFAEELCLRARSLGLPNINFKCEVREQKITSTGRDEIEFLCSFNKNGIPRPLSEIASGGEISRMMLSLKSILAGRINLPTIIFDEVDTGVSGEIADKMGNMMHDIADDMQVIVITHLPQVAAKGDEHFKVYKTDGEHRTMTKVTKLDREGRIRELAAMISGSEISDAAMSAARALLNN